MAIITIGGNLGAGKTTLAGKLAPALDYEEIYIGGIFREIAAERGMSIEQFYEELKNDPALERSVDERQAKLMREKNNLVIQGRVAWFFAKQSRFRVINLFLAVDPVTGAQRVAERKENIGKPINEVARATTLRTQHERERYASLYGIEDYLAPAHYDFLLDTSRITVKEVFERVMGQLRRSEIIG